MNPLALEALQLRPVPVGIVNDVRRALIAKGVGRADC